MFQLFTVTYGTNPAPFVALRVLQQLAKDEDAHVSQGAEVIRYHSYVDDIFAGADDIFAGIDDVQTAANLQKVVTDIFAAGCFRLDKWASYPDLMPASHHDVVKLDKAN